MHTRRNALAFIGLASAASAAVNADAMASNAIENEEYGQYPQATKGVSTERLAKALERLAKGLRNGDVVPDGDKPLTITSELAPDMWLTQELRLRFYMTEPKA